jgi:signal transduction histidine kinase
MFQQLKFKLTILFTVIAILLKLLFAAIYMYFEVSHGIITTAHILPHMQIMLLEISIISILTFIIGYFFIDSIIMTVEDKFNRLEEFTQDASHELRTPLGIASTSIDLAQKTKNYDQYLPDAKTYIKRASSLIEKLLDMARLDRHTLTCSDIPVREIVDRMLKTFEQKIAEKNLTVTVEGDTSMCADYVLFERVVSNLIENAIKYNEPNGKIRIDIQKRDFIVANTGKKIDTSDLPHIFQRYYQSKVSRSDKGYGIGLALVKYICDLHSWKICAHSNERETVFDIRFK